MEIFLGLAALVAILYFAYLRLSVKPGTTDLKEAGVVLDQPVPETKPETIPEVKPETVIVNTVSTKTEEPLTFTNVLDVNNDGKVNLADAKEAVKKTVTKAKTTAARAKKKK